MYFSHHIYLFIHTHNALYIISCLFFHLVLFLFLPLFLPPHIISALTHIHPSLLPFLPSYSSSTISIRYFFHVYYSFSLSSGVYSRSIQVRESGSPMGGIRNLRYIGTGGFKVHRDIKQQKTATKLSIHNTQ